jgi:hypothetical protein
LQPGHDGVEYRPTRQAGARLAVLLHSKKVRMANGLR